MMVAASDLWFSHPSGVTPFRGFSLSVRRGESLAVLGPSGCGKSTLMLLLSGLLAPQSGAILIGGEPIKGPRPSTALVLQDHGLLPWATVKENVMLPLKIRRRMRRGAHGALAEAYRWIDRLQIGGLGDCYIDELSRGQRQRTAIARALVIKPDLLLLDEPFSSLDPPVRAELQGVLRELHDETGLTSITVTHDVDEALILGDRIALLSGGGNERAAVLANPLERGRRRREDSDFSLCSGELREMVMNMPRETR